VWWWFVFWVLIVFLLLSTGGFYGYRRSYYGPSAVFGLIVILFVLFWIAIVFAGPYWGRYGWWW
jgi:hypothetical protein